MLEILALFVFVVVAYAASVCFYNVFLHPLRNFPGPKLWSTTYLIRHVSAMRGDLDWKLKYFHSHYGPVIRYSPGELSFTTEDAWRDIYGNKAEPLIKDPVVYNSVKMGSDGATSIFNADQNSHPRLRKELGHAFSEKALREQEPRLKSYVDLLIQKLRGVAGSKQPTDMVRWYNYTTFDLIGDLSIGKSFNCLKDSEYHSWVRNLQQGTKIGPYIRTIATYTDFNRVWRILAPSAIKKARLNHETYVRQNAEERLARGVMEDRRDFMSYILKNRGKEGGITDKEVAANCGFLIIAGSEAPATAMSGITYYLLKNQEALMTLTKEIRSTFQNEDDIDFLSTSQRLPYLMACISEGMRVYPPTPHIPPRKTPPGKMTTIAGREVPGWTSVGVHGLSATTAEWNFSRPKDFIPERWLPSSTKDPSSPFFKDHRDVVQPFSVGARSCLGKPLAYNEMRVILARLLWNFDLEICEESENTWLNQRTYTLWEKRPLMCRLRDVRKEA